MADKTPAKETQVEEAQIAADVAAEHAAKAAEAADEAEYDLADASKDKASNRICPNCKGEMFRHGDENPFKAGAWHCNQCGACWAPGLKRMRDGHPAPNAVPTP